MNRKRLLSLACLALLSVPAAFAQGPGGMPHRAMDGARSGGMPMGPGGMWWKNPHMIQLLTLTPEQQKKMNDIFEASRIQLIDLHANVQKAEVPMEALLAANPPDTGKVLAQIDKVAEARKELEKADARMLLGIRGVLTPEQWTKLQAEERSHRGGGMRDGKGKGMKDPKGGWQRPGPGAGPDGGPGGQGWQRGPGRPPVPQGGTPPPPPPSAPSSPTA